MFRTASRLSDAVRMTLVAELGARVADVYDLYLQAKTAHWNARGPGAQPFHLLFDEIAGVLAGAGDKLAERAVALGGEVRATGREVAQRSTIPEYPSGIVAGLGHVAALFERVGVLAGRLHSSASVCHQNDDLVTENLLLDLIATVEFWGQRLAAHLDAPT